MLKKIALGVGAALILFLIVVALQPSDFQVQRSAVIQASPEVVFAQVNDFHKWQDWSPWAKRDPQARNTYEGAPQGVGSGFSWAGNSEVGEGRMTLLESVPSSLIRIKLEFFKPFPNVNDVDFTFQPEGPGTKVTWTMKGPKNFVSKLCCLFMDMDKMVGGDFEKGLAEIKRIAETTAPTKG